MLCGWEGNRRPGESNGSWPPGGWLPVHRDQLRAQHWVTSMGSLFTCFPAMKKILFSVNDWSWPKTTHGTKHKIIRAGVLSRQLHSSQEKAHDNDLHNWKWLPVQINHSSIILCKWSQKVHCMAHKTSNYTRSHKVTGLNNSCIFKTGLHTNYRLQKYSQSTSTIKCKTKNTQYIP